MAQSLIGRRYALTRQFWGTASSEDSQREAYAGLGALFRQDSRFTDKAGAARPQFAAFLEKAICHFCDHSLS